MKILVTGAGGHIGNALVKELKARGAWVRGVDIRQPSHEISHADQFESLDLRRRSSCLEVMRGIDRVFALAAEMGGMGFISKQHAEILHTNALINWHTLEAARLFGVERYFFASSACVYPEHRQESLEALPLREEDAYPAFPQGAYGWEKLSTERLCQHYADQYGFAVRVARFHNVYGPGGAWRGGREKAPAALCRKVAVAKITGDLRVNVWGDGKARRSYLYLDDCIEGILRIVDSTYTSPLNLGSDRDVSVDELVNLIAHIADVDVEKVHVPGPEGVRARNSDNTRMREVLGWEPSKTLEEGIQKTYVWIERQVRRALERGESV